MGQTVAEKIISHHSGRSVQAGELAIVSVDGVMATDATGPMAIKAFHEMGGETLWDAARVSMILDHATPAPNEKLPTCTSCCATSPLRRAATSTTWARGFAIS